MNDNPRPRFAICNGFPWMLYMIWCGTYLYTVFIHVLWACHSLSFQVFCHIYLTYQILVFDLSKSRMGVSVRPMPCFSLRWHDPWLWCIGSASKHILPCCLPNHPDSTLTSFNRSILTISYQNIVRPPLDHSDLFYSCAKYNCSISRSRLNIYV